MLWAMSGPKMRGKVEPLPVPDPFDGFSEQRVPFGPQTLVRKLTQAKIQAKIQASGLPVDHFKITPTGGWILVQAKIRPECVVVIQAIADDELAL